MSKAGEWIRRYLPAELLSFVTTLCAALLSYNLTHNKVVTALAATWGGNIGYFGYILAVDMVNTARQLSVAGSRYGLKTFTANVRALIVEFGVAEILDTLLIRPALMYYLPVFFNNLTMGIIVAKFAADITFYIPAIAGYEFSKKHFRNFK